MDNRWGSVADWVVGAGTLILAATAVFQETIRGWFYRPRFNASIKTEAPDCVAVDFTKPDGTFVAHSIYLRLWVENVGNATAVNAEVFARNLRRQRADRSWEGVTTFLPMNLKWSNIGQVYFPRIAPEMGKHCDLGHIVDPMQRHMLREDAPRLALTTQQTSLSFDVVWPSNQRGHIIGPGDYRIDLLIAAENARPITITVSIALRGFWVADDTKMLRDGIGVAIVQD